MDPSALNYNLDANNDNGTCEYAQYIDLETGWNMWSTYLDPSTNDFCDGLGGSMVTIFSDIVDDLVIVKDQYGSVYWPAYGLNSIGCISNGKGYQAKMSSDVTLIVEGSLIPSDLDLTLSEGWGMLGYLNQDCFDIEDMMSSVVENMVIAKDQYGNVYWPGFGLNSIGDMCPGKGYQVKMNTSTSFIYPSASRFGFSDFTQVVKTIYYDKPNNTGNNMTIGLPLNAWEVIPSVGDEIAAYDESNRLIGSARFNGENIALTVWGNDLTTDIKDGLEI